MYCQSLLIHVKLLLLSTSLFLSINACLSPATKPNHNLAWPLCFSTTTGIDSKY